MGSGWERAANGNETENRTHGVVCFENLFRKLNAPHRRHTAFLPIAAKSESVSGEEVLQTLAAELENKSTWRQTETGEQKQTYNCNLLPTAIRLHADHPRAWVCVCVCSISIYACISVEKVNRKAFHRGRWKCVRKCRSLLSIEETHTKEAGEKQSNKH